MRRSGRSMNKKTADRPVTEGAFILAIDTIFRLIIVLILCRCDKTLATVNDFNDTNAHTGTCLFIRCT